MDQFFETRNKLSSSRLPKLEETNVRVYNYSRDAIALQIRSGKTYHHVALSRAEARILSRMLALALIHARKGIA